MKSDDLRSYVIAPMLENNRRVHLLFSGQEDVEAFFRLLITYVEDTAKPERRRGVYYYDQSCPILRRSTPFFRDEKTQKPIKLERSLNRLIVRHMVKEMFAARDPGVRYWPAVFDEVFMCDQDRRGITCRFHPEKLPKRILPEVGNWVHIVDFDPYDYTFGTVQEWYYGSCLVEVDLGTRDSRSRLAQIPTSRLVVMHDAQVGQEGV